MSQFEPENPLTPSDSSPEGSAGAPVPVDTPAALPAAIAIASREQQERQDRGFDRWMVLLITLAVGASCLLISAGKGTKEGMRPWGPNSVLHGVVDLLNFNSAYPTYRGISVKFLAQGAAAGAALLVAGLVWFVRSRRDEDVAPSLSAAGLFGQGKGQLGWDDKQIIPATAAQMALLFFGFWAVLSHLWAHYPQGALNEGIRVAMLIIWAVAIGRTLTQRGAIGAAVGMMAMLLVTAIIGLWYYYERNPFMRLEFPIGGPIFFAACMLPGIVLSMAGLAWVVEHAMGLRTATGASSSPSSSKTGTVGSNVHAVPAWLPWVIGIGSIVTLVVIGWAFVLTRSRSPQVALVVALAAGVAILISRQISAKHRRLLVLGVVLVGLVGTVFVGRPWWEHQLQKQEAGRGASVRLRLAAWRYAGELFASQRLAGHGQGGYLLLSQKLACMPRDDFGQVDQNGRSDIERDPTAFSAAEMIGHAHNEWLEILADLGAIGFAAIVTALGMTLWAGVRGFIQATDPARKWCLLGLVVSLIAIVVEEFADVALRMPGLPIIFYTVIGLIWAMSLPPHFLRASGLGSWPGRLLPNWSRPLVLLGVLMAAGGMISAAQRDWRSALSDGQSDLRAAEGRWDEAMYAAARGIPHRMVLEDELSARLNLTWAAYNGMQNCMQQIMGTLSRQKQPVLNAPRVIKLIETDFARFDEYYQICMDSGRDCWRIMPYIREVSGWMAEGQLLKARVESIKQQLGMKWENDDYLAKAREFMLWEYLRNRLDTVNALRVYDLHQTAPVGLRVDLLRLPLRTGPDATLRAAVEAKVAQLVESEPTSLNHYLEVLMRAGDPAATQPSGDQPTDAYVPETLRLRAMAARFGRNPQLAATLAAQAVEIYEAPGYRLYYPTALSYGLLEWARYAFLDNPADAQRAADACRRAIEAWPKDRDRDVHIKPMFRDLALFKLAAGDENGASKLIVREVGIVGEEQIARNMAHGYVELSGLFMDRSPKDRPAAFSRWLGRSLELAPHESRVRWLAAHVALDEGRGTDAVEHLRVMEKNIDAAQMGAVAAGFAGKYPQIEELKAYAASLAETRPADSQPDTTKPARVPTPAKVPEYIDPLLQP